MSYRNRDPINAAAIAAAVLFYMPGWTLKPPDEDKDAGDYEKTARRIGRAVLEHPTQGALGFYAQDYEGKLYISGDFPHNYGPTNLYSRDAVPVTSIHVNPSRPAKAIAADITARVLPGYLEARAKAVELKATHDAAKRQTIGNVERLAKALGTESPTKDPRKRESNYHGTTDDWTVYTQGGRWKLSSYKPAAVNIELHDVAIDVALKIAAALTAGKKTRA